MVAQPRSDLIQQTQLKRHEVPSFWASVQSSDIDIGSLLVSDIDREFEFYEFFSFLKFNEF